MRFGEHVVPMLTVQTLVQQFIDRDKGYCSVFSAKKEHMHEAFKSLPEVVPGWVDFDAAARIISDHQCHKMTGGCNSWTPWMRARLNDEKIKRMYIDSEGKYIKFREIHK